MQKAIIIGGGLAGLTSAVLLSELNYKVQLIEASPKLGGRASSFNYQNTSVDNGQHLLMGCYSKTFDLLNKIDGYSLLDIQKRLNLKFVDEQARTFNLKAASNVYPLNLLIGLMNYKVLSFTDRIKIIKLFSKIILIKPQKLKNKNVQEWLLENSQSENAIKHLWEVINFAVMNCPLELASAEIFVRVLKTIFLNGNKFTSIGIASVSLQNLFADKSLQFIEQNNGSVFLSEKVTSVICDNNKIIKIITNKNTYEDFDIVISAIPLNHFVNVFEDYSEIGIEHYKHASILNIHLWLTPNKFDEGFWGLLNSKVQWVFNKGDYISLVISSADEFINLTKDEILEFVYNDLENHFNCFSREQVFDYKIIKEKRATFIPLIEFEEYRKTFQPKSDNLIVTGDWTNTGFPATIEGAVLSAFNGIANVKNKTNL